MVYANAISSNTSDSSNKYGASSEKMAAAYAAFANGGTYYKPYLMLVGLSLVMAQPRNFESEGTRAMKATTAYMMTDMMKTVLLSGTGTNAAISGIYQAGKTGTSNYADNEIGKLTKKCLFKYCNTG